MDGATMLCLHTKLFSKTYLLLRPYAFRDAMGKWAETVLSVVRTNHVLWIMLLLRFIAGNITMSILFVYVTQCGTQCEEKDDFYTVLVINIPTITPDDMLMVCGDLNGHVGKDS